MPPAVDGEPSSTHLSLPGLLMPCQDCFITGARVDMVHADGTSANLDRGVMLHHVMVFNSGPADATCAPDTTYGERFFLGGTSAHSGSCPTASVIPSGRIRATAWSRS